MSIAGRIFPGFILLLGLWILRFSVGVLLWFTQRPSELISLIIRGDFEDVVWFTAAWLPLPFGLFAVLYGLSGLRGRSPSFLQHLQAALGFACFIIALPRASVSISVVVQSERQISGLVLYVATIELLVAICFGLGGYLLVRRSISGQEPSVK